MKVCVDLGKNRCNGYIATTCFRCPTRYDLILITGPSEEVVENVSNVAGGSMVRYGGGDSHRYYTWLLGNCSTWYKWPSNYFYGRLYNDETHLSLAAAQESCHLHGSLCYAVKGKEGKYFLMRIQDTPSEDSADYWVKLATNN